MPDSQKLSSEDLIKELQTSGTPVRLEGKTFEQDLNLSGIDLPVAVSLRNCTFEGTVDLSLAQTAASLDLSGSIFEKGLSLEGTRIGHHLILDGCTFKAPSETALNTCRIEIKGDLLLKNSPKFFSPWDGEDMQIHGGIVAEGLTMEGESPPSARLNQARVDGGIFIEEGSFGEFQLGSSRIGLGFRVTNSTFAGEAGFHGVHIGGLANFKGVSFKGAVVFDGAEIKSDLFLWPDEKGNPCSIEGEASFLGAHIDGQASFDGVSFKSKAAFDRAEINGSLFLQPDEKGNPCSIGGEARFLGAHIGGQANFKGVSFKGAVVFDGAEIKSDLFLRPDEKGHPCSIGGEARFYGTHIDGQANFENVLFKREVVFQGTHVDGEVLIIGTTIPKFSADGAHFSKTLKIDVNTEIGDLILRNARVGSLDIHWQRISGELKIMACEYSSIENKKMFLEVLLAKGVRGRQPYEFLENHCRNIGEANFANNVYYKHCLFVAPSWKKLLESPYWRNFTSVLWDRLLRYSAGYGVRPSRLLRWVGVSFVLAFLMFMCPLFVKSVGGFVERTPPWDVAIWLSVKALMPFGTSVEYTANDVWRWQPTLVGAISFNILKILVWVGISAGTMSIGGLFRRYSK